MDASSARSSAPASAAGGTSEPPDGAPTASPASRVREGILYEFDEDYLDALVDRHGGEYRTAEPFPHVVIDGFLPETVASALLDEWPDFDAIHHKTFDDRHEFKHVCSDMTLVGARIRGLLAAFNGSQFVRFLERMTGIGPLVTDPHLAAAGLFEVPPGGRLDPHTDFTQGARTRLARRINVLYYMNRGWREEHGGQLELWCMNPLRCMHSIVPLFNRLVIFNTAPTALHGHPYPVAAEVPGGSRKCLSTYYFTKERPIREALSGRHAVVFADDPHLRSKGRTQALWDLAAPPLVDHLRRRIRRRRR
ncbi:MAG: 2OG-Fe(II) oxygenase [Acidimicrobiia bacterium]